MGPANYFFIHTNPPMGPILKHMNPFYIFTPYLFMTHFNIIFTIRVYLTYFFWSGLQKSCIVFLFISQERKGYSCDIQLIIIILYVLYRFLPSNNNRQMPENYFNFNVHSCLCSYPCLTTIQHLVSYIPLMYGNTRTCTCLLARIWNVVTAVELEPNTSI